MRTFTFDCRKTRDGEFRAVLTASNGEIVLVLESYQRKAGLSNGIESVMENGKDVARYVIRTAKNGKHYFVLTARNNRVIGCSETYSSISEVRDTIDSMIEHIAGAKVKLRYKWYNFAFETVYGIRKEEVEY